MAALVCAVVFGFTSCNKDGVYKPKEKIEKIYVQYEGQDKVLTETWDWEDNLLKSIKHADTDPIGDNSYTETFTYDKKQVKSISDGTYTMTYNYDGRYFDNIKVTEGSDEVGTMTFSHDGKLISKIDITLNDDDFMKSRMAESAMRFIAPEFACDFGKIMQAEARFQRQNRNGRFLRVRWCKRSKGHCAQQHRQCGTSLHLHLQRLHEPILQTL